ARRWRLRAWDGARVRRTQARVLQASAVGQLLAQSGDRPGERAPDGVDRHGIRFAGPFVHERLLDFDRKRARGDREAIVNPPHEMPTLKPDVLAHVRGIAAVAAD